MANLKNIDKIWDAELGTVVTVGNNRTVERKLEGKHPVFHCRLHGHVVARIKPHGSRATCSVTLDTCGWHTVTTGSAMRDFLSVFGAEAGVSLARGALSVRVKRNGEYEQYESTTGAVSFWAERHAAPQRYA